MLLPITQEGWVNPALYFMQPIYRNGLFTA
ncbi:hypothetical protein SRDD_03930 [Serratia sp. DD3]|nr:hypothetical protein SRDD_03930 [Serratia sp. DD3]